jgi:glycosyltransferase involved in cell wall biosynthesis
MSPPLHIALTVDPYIPVPPRTYGGFERIAAWLVDELIQRGHTISLLAHPDSRTRATLVPYGVPPHTGPVARTRELWQVASALVRRRRDLDLVHSFGRLAALLPVLADRRLPKIQSYGRYISWRGVGRASALAGDSLIFTACSDRLWQKDDPRLRRGDWRTVYNGVDLSLYTATREVPADAPLVFLGRLEFIKGVHHAIDVALAHQRRLVIAGNRVDSVEGRRYFESLRPRLSHPLIEYVGPVDDEQKNRLLQGAAALLMLIEWEEPFGIVMAEAMACGTPVIGFRRGAVPEVVIDGVTGCVVDSVDEAVAAVDRVRSFERARIREHAAARFSHRAIVDQYEALYYERVASVQHTLQVPAS